jgi:Ca2+-binding RTX toxin-like protein
MRGEDDPSNLHGGVRTDSLYGYTLSDTLNGGTGVDRMYGYAGDDIVYIGLTSTGRVYGARDIADRGPGSDNVYFEEGVADDVNANCEIRNP